MGPAEPIKNYTFGSPLSLAPANELTHAANPMIRDGIFDLHKRRDASIAAHFTYIQALYESRLSGNSERFNSPR